MHRVDIFMPSKSGINSHPSQCQCSCGIIKRMAACCGCIVLFRSAKLFILFNCVCCFVPCLAYEPSTSTLEYTDLYNSSIRTIRGIHNSDWPALSLRLNVHNHTSKDSFETMYFGNITNHKIPLTLYYQLKITE